MSQTKNITDILPKVKKEFDAVRIFYTDDKKTIVVLHRGDIRFVGISLCGRKDQFARKVGRSIAIGRALKAAEIVKQNVDINAQAQRFLSSRGTSFWFTLGSKLPENVDIPAFLYENKEVEGHPV